MNVVAKDAAEPIGATAYIRLIEEKAHRAVQDPVATLQYGDAPGQQLEVYRPSGQTGPLPVVVFFHGGAWIRGGLPWLRFMAPAVTALPAVFVAGTYRLAPQHRWPLPYEDVREAIRHVHRTIASHGGDPERIVVGGHSAGGHLAALAVLKREIPPVLGCLPVSAPLDLRYGDIPIDSEDARAYKYLLNERHEDADASPLAFVAGNRVPFHVLWAARDFHRIIKSSAAMVQALREAGSPVTQDVVDGAGHFDTHLMLEQTDHRWYARVRELLGGAHG